MLQAREIFVIGSIYQVGMFYEGIKLVPSYYPVLSPQTRWLVIL